MGESMSSCCKPQCCCRCGLFGGGIWIWIIIAIIIISCLCDNDSRGGIFGGCC